MFKRSELTFILVGVSVLLMSVGLMGFVPVSHTDEYESVCKVENASGQGSGTLIAVKHGKALVLTCRHVSGQPGNSVMLTWPCSHQQVKGEVIAIAGNNDFVDDLALIKCDAPEGVRPLHVDKFNRWLGHFRAVGFRGEEMLETVALVADKHGESLIEVDEPFQHGMSGGPLLDSRGYVVGVVVGSDFKTWGLAADGENLEILLNENKGKL